MMMPFLMMPMQAFAQEQAHAKDHQHGSEIYHAINIETGYGGFTNGNDIWESDIKGWVGTDENKLLIKSEVERIDDVTDKNELWALYSRNIDDFWDAQIGVRHDFKPEHTSYLVVGFAGLAAYFMETDGYLFLSEDGDVTGEIKKDTDFLITQRTVMKPYGKLSLSAQDIPTQDTGTGLTEAELGLQTRYEMTRAFAPYIDMKYKQKLGETANIANQNGGDSHSFMTTVGVKLLF